ncbi:MAG: ribose-phosphate pyrophosphokinase [Planctomycetaceae bacterium]|nr:ribose-phosphate pyrophosphokinase [Planctomycetota bacterium]NUN53332.1 ribose-phosphate pyrophosphokinase [Planctomycetaceae bacterium]
MARGAGFGDVQIFTGTAHPGLAAKIASYLGIRLGDALVGRFPDGEVNVKINEDVRGNDCFVVQPTCPPVNDSLMEALLLIDCLRRSSAGRITAVFPYFGYARKDRKDEGRVPISAKLVANLVVSAGVDRVLALDLHAAQIQGFFDIPVDHLFSSPVMVRHLQSMGLKDIVIVAPDVGGIKMARAYAKSLGAGLAIVDKRRISPESAEAVHVIGEVEGRTVVLVDDMISTAGTITEAAKTVKAHGAAEVFICATHPVLCGPAVERLSKAPVSRILVTDTIPPAVSSGIRNLEVLTISELLGEAIRRIHVSESVSSLFL